MDIVERLINQKNCADSTFLLVLKRSKISIFTKLHNSEVVNGCIFLSPGTCIIYIILCFGSSQLLLTDCVVVIMGLRPIE